MQENFSLLEKPSNYSFIIAMIAGTNFQIKKVIFNNLSFKLTICYSHWDI